MSDVSEVKKMKERQMRGLAAPMFAPRILIEKLSIPRTTLNNWHVNRQFDLDADREREGFRLYSARDAVLLCAASQLVAIGAPLSIASDIAKLAWGMFNNMLGTVLALAASETDRFSIVAFRHQNEWWRFTCFSTELRKAEVLRDNDWLSVEPTAAPEIPPVRIVFELSDFFGHVLPRLGYELVWPETSGIEWCGMYKRASRAVLEDREAEREFERQLQAKKTET